MLVKKLPFVYSTLFWLIILLPAFEILCQVSAWVSSRKEKGEQVWGDLISSLSLIKMLNDAISSGQWHWWETVDFPLSVIAATFLWGFANCFTYWIIRSPLYLVDFSKYVCIWSFGIGIDEVFRRGPIKNCIKHPTHCTIGHQVAISLGPCSCTHWSNLSLNRLLNLILALISLYFEIYIIPENWLVISVGYKI